VPLRSLRSPQQPLCSRARSRLGAGRSSAQAHDAQTVEPQLLLAARDQLSFGLAEDTREFYRSQGIPWTFHNLRRVVAFPSSMIDPVGLFSPRDTIIHHVLQTFHRHPLYDLVLLRAHDRGLEEMEAQLLQLLAGTHSHQRSLTSLIEDGSYHQRLLDDVREVMRDPHMLPRPIPAGLVDNPQLMLAMDQFKDLRGDTNYASRLKVTPVEALLAYLPMALNEMLGVRIGQRCHQRIAATVIRCALVDVEAAESSGPCVTARARAGNRSRGVLSV